MIGPGGLLLVVPIRIIFKMSHLREIWPVCFAIRGYGGVGGGGDKCVLDARPPSPGNCLLAFAAVVMALAVMDVMYHTAIAVLPSSSSSSSSSSSVKANVQQQMLQQQLHPWSAAGGGGAAAAAGGGWQVLVQKRKDVKKLVTEFLGDEGMHRLCLRREEAIVKRGGRGRLGGGRVGSSNGFAPVTMSSSSSKGAGAIEVYEVELEKPFGIKFYKGSDGGTYIDAIAAGGSADKTKMLTPGDRVIATR